MELMEPMRDHRHQRSGERLDPGGVFRFGVVVSSFSLDGLYMIPFILFK